MKDTVLQEVHLPVNAETLKRKYHQVYEFSKCIWVFKIKEEDSIS